MTVKITSRHEADLKNRESQYECDLAMQAAKFEDENRALTLRFKDEICNLRKVPYLYNVMFYNFNWVLRN